MSKSKPTGRELVDLYIQQLPENTRPAVAYLRQLVLSVDKEITEHIKWNAPAFYYAGEMKAFDPKHISGISWC